MRRTTPKARKPLPCNEKQRKAHGHKGYGLFLKLVREAGLEPARA